MELRYRLDTSCELYSCHQRAVKKESPDLFVLSFSADILDTLESQFFLLSS